MPQMKTGRHYVELSLPNSYEAVVASRIVLCLMPQMKTGRHCMLGSGAVELLLPSSYEAAVASRIVFVNSPNEDREALC